MRRQKTKIVIVSAIVLLVAALSLFAFGFLVKNYKQELLQNPVVQRMVPLYRSLRKVPDIVFDIRYAFSKTKLNSSGYMGSLQPTLR